MRPDLDPSKPIVPIAYPRLILDLLGERGFSRETVLEGTLLNPAIFDQADARIAPAQMVHIIANALHYSKDPTLGYEFGLRTQLTAHGFLGYALMSCANLREAIKLGARFMRLRTVLFGLHFYEEGDYGVIEITENYPLGILRQFTMENMLVGLARAGNFLTGASWDSGEIWFDYPEPDYYPGYKDRLPPMRFNRGANQLRFPSTLLGKPLLMSDPVAAQLAIEQCERELSLISDDDDIPMRVRAVLTTGNGGYPDLEAVAARLFMSSRTLKRRLQQHGQSFQHLLDEVRKRDAIRLLENQNMTLEQIAHRLGYADPANFTRAFRKWTGEAPSRYREMLVGER